MKAYWETLKCLDPLITKNGTSNHYLPPDVRQYKTVNLVSGTNQHNENKGWVGKTAFDYGKLNTITKCNVWICSDPDSNKPTVKSHF